MTAVTAVTLPEQTVGAIMSTADAADVAEVAETADVVVLAGGTGTRLDGASKPDVVARGLRLLDHVLAELLRYVRSQPTAPTMTAYDLRSQERQHAVAQAQQAAAGLSRRELEVIAAAAEGLTTEEIANRLYISVSTVKAHLRSAQERVGARNRVHLAVLAERAGLLG